MSNLLKQNLVYVIIVYAIFMALGILGIMYSYFAIDQIDAGNRENSAYYRVNLQVGVFQMISSNLEQNPISDVYMLPMTSMPLANANINANNNSLGECRNGYQKQVLKVWEGLPASCQNTEDNITNTDRLIMEATFRKCFIDSDPIAMMTYLETQFCVRRIQIQEYLHYNPQLCQKICVESSTCVGPTDPCPLNLLRALLLPDQNVNLAQDQAIASTSDTLRVRLNYNENDNLSNASTFSPHMALVLDSADKLSGVLVDNNFTSPIVDLQLSIQTQCNSLNAYQLRDQWAHDFHKLEKTPVKGCGVYGDSNLSFPIHQRPLLEVYTDNGIFASTKNIPGFQLYLASSQRMFMLNSVSRIPFRLKSCELQVRALTKSVLNQIESLKHVLDNLYLAVFFLSLSIVILTGVSTMIMYVALFFEKGHTRGYTQVAYTFLMLFVILIPLLIVQLIIYLRGWDFSNKFDVFREDAARVNGCFYDSMLALPFSQLQDDTLKMNVREFMQGANVVLYMAVGVAFLIALLCLRVFLYKRIKQSSFLQENYHFVTLDKKIN